MAVAGSISGNIVDTVDTMEFCASRGLRPIQTIVLADQLDDVFEVLSNPATTIARYTLDVKRSFQKLIETENAEINLVDSDKSEDDAPDFEDVADAGDDEGLGAGAGSGGGAPPASGGVGSSPAPESSSPPTPASDEKSESE